MKIKWGSIFVLSFSVLLISLTSYAQKKHPGARAYLILKNRNEIIKADSLFENELRSRVSIVLKKKNITLAPDSLIEAPDQMSIYYEINISDSLRISAWKGKAPDGLGSVIVIPKKSSFTYTDRKDVIKKVVAYIKKNISKR